MYNGASFVRAFLYPSAQPHSSGTPHPTPTDSLLGRVLGAVALTLVAAGHGDDMLMMCGK